MSCKFFPNSRKGKKSQVRAQEQLTVSSGTTWHDESKAMFLGDRSPKRTRDKFPSESSGTTITGTKRQAIERKTSRPSVEGVNETKVLAHRDVKDIKEAKYMCMRVHTHTQFLKNKLFKIFINLSKTQ